MWPRYRRRRHWCAEGMTTGIKITGQAINCQKDAHISRAHGIFVDLQVITNKSAARCLNPSGVLASFDSIVTALICTYAKNSIIRITGDKGDAIAAGSKRPPALRA